ncbi:MAG: LacI family DNA-binding transcriptional regulator [Gemmobacter sp.]
MAHRATIQDLAERAGVSVSTIDRILNGRDKVRVGTATRVLAAAEDLEFYALPALRKRLQVDQPKRRLGFLLQQSHRTFYRLIANALSEAAALSPEPVEVIIEHLDDLTPESVAGRMLRMGEQVQALAVVSAEHPRVASAIETLAAQGVVTYGLISELTAACGAGYIGLDNWKVGRTAGWAIAGFCKRPGSVGIVVGNHRYRCQELNESGFRSYCREHAPDLTLLEPVQTFEDNAVAREVTEQLLKREPGLVALYVAGGGMPGVLDALRSSGRGRSILALGHDLTTHTRAGLMDNLLSMVFAHPIRRLATDAIDQMQRDVSAGNPPSKRVLNFEIYGPENI